MSSARGVIFDELAARVVPQGRRLGLVIGIDCYAPESGVPRLRAAVADARAIRALMVDPECGRFREELTTILVDAEATETNIRIELERLRRNATPADEVWFFFAGHALVVDSEHRLLPVNVRRDYLDATSVDFAAYFRKIRCRRKIVFLDCCHSGATDSSTRSLHDVDEVFHNYEATGTVIYCSSDGDQKSVELVEEGHGAFTFWLEKGLRGAADADSNGVVTSDELWKYVCEHVERDAHRLTGVAQTPRLKLDVNGSFPLSVNAAVVRAREEALRAAEEEQRVRDALREADGVTLRQLLGDDDLKDLSTDEVKAARALLANEPSGRLASEIHRALTQFRTAGDRDVGVLHIRGALASSTKPGSIAANIDRLVHDRVAENGPPRDANPSANAVAAVPSAPKPASTPVSTITLPPAPSKTRGPLRRERNADGAKAADSSASATMVSRRLSDVSLIVVGSLIGWTGFSIATNVVEGVEYLLRFLLGITAGTAAVLGWRAPRAAHLARVLLFTIPATCWVFADKYALWRTLDSIVYIDLAMALMNVCGLTVSGLAYAASRLRAPAVG
jgi:hypothetical protein